MAVLSGNLDLHTVQTLRGVVDFYYDHGQLIARAWPRPPVQPHSEKQVMHWRHLARMREWTYKNPPEWKEQIARCSESPTQSADDRARWCAWRLTEDTVPPPIPVVEKAVMIPIDNGNGFRVELHVRKPIDTGFFSWTVCAMAARPEEEKLRWYKVGEECGRFGQRRELFAPPVSSAILPHVFGSVPGMGVLWATFQAHCDSAWVWPVLIDKLHNFTGAAYKVAPEI